MTFTNKAAAEMGERVEKLVGGLSVAKPVISTFHSFCVRVLRRDIEALRIPSSVPGVASIGLTKIFVDLRRGDQQAGEVGHAAAWHGRQADYAAMVLSHISWAKNHMLDPQEVYLQSSDPKTERVAHVYEEYRKELAQGQRARFRRSAAGDGASAESRACEVRDYTTDAIQYMLIDEYQDTNRPQYETHAAAGGQPEHNICVVGDEDQSHLFLARRGHPQHSGVRARLSRSQDDSPGTELPFDPEHSAGRVGGGCE